MKWATVCFDKKEGGLEVRGFYNLNKALLSKQVALALCYRERFHVEESYQLKIWGLVFSQSARNLWNRSLERD